MDCRRRYSAYTTAMNDPANSATWENSSVFSHAPTWVRLALDNWMERHRLPFNFWIHMVGIPMAVVGLLLFFLVEWYWALAAFVLGYVLQWIGHVAEGNDVGEWAAIKSMLGLPYVGIAPRWRHGEDGRTR